MKKKFAIFISGYGRGAIDIIKKCKSGLVCPDLSLIVSNNNQSRALQFADNLNINNVIIEREKDKSIFNYENELIVQLKKHEIDYIFLAGWKYILSSNFITNYENKIVNIHPSLLPSFKGLNAIDQALDYGVKVTGVTTHYVDASIDGGRIILQKPVIIHPDDNFNTLDEKIFEEGTRLSAETINKVFV